MLYNAELRNPVQYSTANLPGLGGWYVKQPSHRTVPYLVKVHYIPVLLRLCRGKNQPLGTRLVQQDGAASWPLRKPVPSQAQKTFTVLGLSEEEEEEAQAVQCSALEYTGRPLDQRSVLSALPTSS